MNSAEHRISAQTSPSLTASTHCNGMGKTIDVKSGGLLLDLLLSIFSMMCFSVGRFNDGFDGVSVCGSDSTFESMGSGDGVMGAVTWNVFVKGFKIAVHRISFDCF